MGNDAPDSTNAAERPVPPEVVAMGQCWPAIILERRFARAMNLPRLPGKVDGMPRSEYLLRHGYALAWANGRFETVEQFRIAMRSWQWWVRGILLIEAVGFAIAVVEAVAWYGRHWWHG